MPTIKKVVIAAALSLLGIVAQAQCVGCPPLSSDSVPSVPCAFNGQTSSVTNYNGITPTCYNPVNGSLNGHLQGINNRLCTIRTLVDSLLLISTTCDSVAANLQIQIDSITLLVNQYDVVSTDSSITVTTTTVGDTVRFDLSVVPYVPNVDASCLIEEPNPTLDQILQALITAACLNEEEE